MRYLRLILAASILVVFSGCSTIHVNQGFQDAKEILENQSYFLRVQTRNETMDKMVYELAGKEFGQYIPLADKEPYTGLVDVLFFKTAEGNYIDPNSMFSTVAGYADRWYTKDGYIGLDNSYYTIGESIASGGMFTWQNSTMLVNITDHNRKRVWSVEYKYRVDGEIPGWFINSYQEVIHLCIKRIAQRMEKDFRPKRPPVITTGNYTSRRGI